MLGLHAMTVSNLQASLQGCSSGHGHLRTPARPHLSLLRATRARPAATRRQAATTCVATPAQPTASSSSMDDHPHKIVSTGLPRTAVVGVLGGGQLGKMLAQEAVSAKGRGAALRRDAPCFGACALLSVWPPSAAAACAAARPGRRPASTLLQPHSPKPPGARAIGPPALQAKMGVKLKVLDPTPNCPASVVAEQVVGSFRDPEAVKAFAQVRARGVVGIGWRGGGGAGRL